MLRQGIGVGQKRVRAGWRWPACRAHKRRRRKGWTVLWRASSRSGASSVETSAPTPDLVRARGHQADPAPGEGALHLASCRILFSRRIVGWAMAHMRSEVVVAALKMAVRRRWPAKGKIHHSAHRRPVHRPGIRRDPPRCPPSPPQISSIARRTLLQCQNYLDR
jgi:hypothetical protein